MTTWLCLVMCASAAGCSSITSAGFQARGGPSWARDPAPDSPEGTGALLGIRFVGMKALDERWSIGGHALLAFHVADAKGDDHTTTYFYFDPGLQARGELGRFALHGWLGYVLGFRSVDDGGRTDKTQVAFSGPTAGTALLVRIGVPGDPGKPVRSFEIGPYIDFGRFTMFEDDDETDFVEDGMHATATSIGIMLQFWSGGGPI